MVEQEVLLFLFGYLTNIISSKRYAFSGRYLVSHTHKSNATVDTFVFRCRGFHIVVLQITGEDPGSDLASWWGREHVL